MGTLVCLHAHPDDEAIATMIGLALLAAGTSDGVGALDDAATRAYGKLDQFLPTHLRPQAAALRSSVEAHQQRTPAVAATTIAALGTAIDRREVIRFDYRDRADSPSSRRVEPYRQVHLRMRWYLLAWDLDRGDWRVFRLDRIDDLERTTITFDERALPALSAVEYLREGMNVERRQIRMTVEARPVDVADAFRFLDCAVEPMSAAGTRVTVAVDSWEWLLPHLARLGSDFRVSDAGDSGQEIVDSAQRLASAVGVHLESSGHD